MRKDAFRSLIAVFITALIGASCSDATRPTPSNYAQYLDSLYFSVASDSGLGEILKDDRTFAIGLFEFAAARGATAKNISVTTSHGVEQWKAFEFVATSPFVGEPQSNILIATRDKDIHSYVYFEYAEDGSMNTAVLTTDDTLRTGAGQRGGTSTVSFDGSRQCEAPPQLNNPNIAPSVPCTYAEFSSSASVDFTVGPLPPPAYKHYSFPTIQISGERFITN